MRTVFFRRLILLLFPVVLLYPGDLPLESGADASVLSAGFSVTVIPFDSQVSYRLGGYEPRQSVSIHDSLTVRSAVISKNGVSVMFVALDLLLIGHTRALEIRRGISRETGIPTGHIIVHTIHTHSAPVVHGVIDYWDLVRDTAISGAAAAWEARTPVEIERLRFNDRFRINNRRKGLQIDSNVDTLIISGHSGSVAGMIVNAGCHPVILGPDNRSISADYVHYLRRYLEDRYDAPVLFLNADQGDKNPPPVGYLRTGNFEDAELFGESIAEKIAAGMADAQPLAVDEITAESLDVLLPVRGSGYAKSWKLDSFLLRIAKNLHPDHRMTAGRKRTTLTLFYLGEVPVITSPGESTRLHRQNLAMELGIQDELYIDLANDYISYIISPEEWDLRNDEERRGKNAGPGTSSFIISKYRELLSRFQFN